MVFAPRERKLILIALYISAIGLFTSLLRLGVPLDDSSSSIRYPEFEFFSHSEAIEQANKISSRTSNGALRNIMIDIYILSQSQYLTCALSSAFARTAYHLMQYEYHDAWKRIGTLDLNYEYPLAFMPERLPIEPVEDLVLHNEIGFVNMTRPEEFTLAAARSVATHSLWAKEKLIPDGTMSTPFGDRVQAKFKTEQAFRTGRYRALAGSLGLTG